MRLRLEVKDRYWAPKNGQIVKNVCDTARDRQDKLSSVSAGSIAWSTEPPHTDGFYWFHAGSRGAKWVVVPVYFTEESATLYKSGYRFGYYEPGVAVEMVGRDARWDGPITPPECGAIKND